MSDKPVFDFTRFSWRDAKTVTRLQARAARVSALLADSATLINESAFNAVTDEQDAIFTELQAYIARCLVSVPRVMLVPDAPAELDWSDPASLDWLRGRAFAELQAMMQEASSPESVTGN